MGWDRTGVGCGEGQDRRRVQEGHGTPDVGWDLESLLLDLPLLLLQLIAFRSPPLGVSLSLAVDYALPRLVEIPYFEVRTRGREEG